MTNSVSALARQTDVRTEKQQAVLDQAIRTFAELGFRGTDVQMIADRAGVGKGTVYRYFGSKEELFQAATYEVDTRLIAYIGEALAEVEDPIETIRIAGLKYAEFFDRHPYHLEIMAQDRAEFRGQVPEAHRQRHEEMIASFGEILQRGIDNGQLRPMDVRQAVLSFGAILYGVAMQACYVKSEYTMVKLSKHAIEIFIRGVSRES